jgi:spermidine/putrescine-binding protein
VKRRAFIAAAVATACARDRRPSLNVYNWSTYIDPAMLDRFEHEHGVRILYGTYESNEEMIAKAMTGNSGWDIVFPTHSRLAPMARNGMLAPLDRRLLPSVHHLHSRFQSPAWDPGLQWGVPYMWNATGIVHNRAQTGTVTGWSALWSPALRRRLTMLDDPEDVIGAALQKLRFPFGSTEEHQLQAARDAAIAQKPLLRAYLNAEVRDQLVSGDVLMAQIWSTTAAQAIHSSANLAFVYPEEGYPLYCDCAAILRGTRRYELAHAFLNFLLQPDVAASNARVAETATANGTAQATLARDPVLYPPDDIYQRGVWPEALPSAAQRYRDRLWTEIKSA